MTNINYGFIESLEGFETSGYVPNAEGSESGVTIGSGVDLGARNVNDLKKLNLSEELIAKLKPYLGRKSTGAESYLEKNPLNLSTEEARYITRAVQTDAANSLARKWKAKTGQDFSELSENKATAVASVAFQYGNLATKTPNYWEQVTSNDWEGAYANLKDFKDDYGTRREKEANFLNPQMPIRKPETNIPRFVETNIPIVARAEGGPVNAGQPYLVGEEGPELVIPKQDGLVLPANNPETQAAVDAFLSGTESNTSRIDPAQMAEIIRSRGDLINIDQVQQPQNKRKVKYVAFDDPLVPRIEIPEEFTPEQIQEYMKSEEAEALMYQKGYLYKYGNQPSSLKDASDQDDWALTAGIKSGYDNLKSIGAGALYTVADAFGDEEKMAQFESMISQYNQDAAVHAYKPGENPGEYDLRITSVEAILEDENKLNAFLDWAAFNVGAGATTMIPIMLASAVGAGVAVVGAPITAATGASIAGMMAAYTMGVGEVTGAQLERSGDANAALSLAAGIPYAAAERFFGTSMIFTRLLGNKYGADVVSDIVKGVAIKKLVEKKITPSLVKEMAKGFGKEFAGEGVTEAIQEVITSSAAELNEGASLGELYQSKDFWKQIGEAAAAGSIAGGTIGGAGGVITYGRKAGTKNRDGALSIKKDPTPDAETMDKVDAEIGDTIEYTGSSTDESVEFTLTGTGVLPNGDSIYVVTNSETGLPDYIKVDNAPKIRKSQLNELDRAALNKSFLPEGTKVDKSFNVKYRAARKKLERQGVINRDRTEAQLVDLPKLDEFYEDELEAYQLAINKQERDKLAGKEVKPIAYKYKTYQGLEGDKFKEAVKIQYENQKKRDIVNFSETSLGDINELTDIEKTELSKLGYYKGTKGQEFINKKLTSVEPKGKTTKGLQDLRDIIISQTPNTPLVVEYNREVSRTQVPPLIPSSFNQTALELEPDQATRLEELTEEKQRYDWELAKADEEIAQLKDNLASLDPTASNIAAETTRITNEINNKESLKQAVAREKSDPLVRIFKIKKLLNNMINSGFKVNMLPTYRIALRQAKIEENKKDINFYQKLINKYKPTKEHAMLFGDTLVYYDSTKAQQQLRAELTEIEKSMRAILPALSNYNELSDDNKILYREYFKGVQKRLNAIKSIDSRRAELNSLLASFNIEPVINWDKQQGKLSIPAFNKTVKELFGYEKVAKEKVRDEYWSLGDNPNSDDRPALSQETIDKMPMVLENLRTELNRLGVGNLDMRLYDNILDKNGAQVNGRFLGGLGMIEVAMNASQSINGRKLNAADSRMFTMHHESMHYIFKELLTPQEQIVLKSAARTAYMKRYNIKRRYQKFSLSEEALLEESISDAFAEYMTVTKNGELYSPKGIIGTIFNRIKNYLIALGNALSNNQLRSTAQIFNNIDNGVMQARRDIKNKINVSETEMINLASIGKISIEQANKFFNQRGRSVVVVGGKSAGSALTNKQLYRSFVINVLPKFTEVRKDLATNKIITALTNLFENITTDSGVPNLEQSNFYLQQLNALTDKELNTAAAFIQSSQEAFSEITSASLLKSSMGTYAGQDVAALFELSQAVELFKTRLARLNRNMPTETDIRIAGTPLIVHHSTSQTALASIMAGGFIAGTDSMGMHFGTQPQAAIRGKLMADAEYQGTGLDAGKGFKTPEWWKPTSDEFVDTPPAETTQSTQRANTIGTYRKIKSKLKEGNTLDYGAGLGLGTSILESDSFEPFPQTSFNPTYTDLNNIPADGYDNVVALNVLNVLPKARRNDAVRGIGRSLKVNGTAFITTRGIDVYGNKQNPARGTKGAEQGSIVTSNNSFQKGFTQAELAGYIQSILGSGFSVEAIQEGAVGVKVTRLEVSLTTPAMLNAVLHIRNPVRMQDMGAQWDSFQTLNELSAFPSNPTEQYGMDLDVSRDMAPAMLTDIIFTPTESAVIRKKMTAAQDKGVPFKEGKSGKIIINKKYKPASLTRQEILQEEIKAKGYDGIVYRNQYEVTADYDGDGGAIESLDSYIVFDADQIQLVEDNPNLDMSDINYSAATEPQEEPSADEMDKQGTEKIRQFLAEAIKGMEASQKARDKITRGKEYGGGGDVSLKDMGFLSKFMQHAAGIAAKFPFVNFFYDTVKAMESKARSLQTQFAGNMSFVYEIINKMEGAKEAINRAAAIAQANPGRYRTDNEGRIIFVAPRQIIMSGGEVIEAGETIVLEGDVARAYVKMIEAGVTLMEEKLRATIAGGKHIPQLREAVALLLKYNPQALQPLIDFGLNVEALTDQNFEALTPVMIQSIVGGLQIVPQLSIDRAMNMSMGQGVSTDFTAILERIEENNATIKGLLGSKTSGLTALNNEAQLFLELTSTDYVPLSRHGTHGITVKNAKGKVVYYEHLSGALTEEAVTGNTTAVKFTEARRKVQDLFPDMEVSEVVKIDDTFRKETRGALAQLDELSQHLSDKNADAYVEVRKELVGVIGSENVVGFDRFTRGRKEIGGVSGFDSDIINSMSEFGMIASEFISRDRYMRDVNKTYADALNYAKDKPRLTEAVKKMKEYGVDNAHSQEWGAVRRMGYWWFLGGNISSGILQLMSIVQFTGPILAQMSGSKIIGGKGTDASVQLSKSFTEAMRLTSFVNNDYNDVFLNLSEERLLQVFGGDKDLVQAVLDAIADGTIKQGQALYESGQAPGFSITPDEDRTNLKVRQKIKILEQKIMGGTFNTFETISRLTGFVAAYRMARDPKVMESANNYFSETDLTWNAMKARKGGVATNRDFADMLVARTFGVYAKIDRPLMMRQGGAAIFLFQTYISQMFGLLRRLLVGQGSAEATAVGRRMFARIMIMLFLTGGLLGMPGADDMDFLYRMTNRMRGVNTDIRQQMKEMLTSKVGAKNTEMVMNGALETFLNVSVQRRVSLGEIPGSAQIRALMTLFGMPTGARAEEFLGAPGAVFIGTANEWKTMFQQQGVVSTLTDMDFYIAAMPTFAKNMYRAAYKYPKDGFVATRRGTLVTADLTTSDLTKQFFGFTPSKLSKGREILYYETQIDTKYQGATRTFNARIKNAYRDMYIYTRLIKDTERYKQAQLRLQEVTRDVMEWNNTIESNYTYVPDLNRLQMEGILQANFNERTLKSNKDTLSKKRALPDRYGIEMD